jgi:hypothetical protein
MVLSPLLPSKWHQGATPFAVPPVPRAVVAEAPDHFDTKCCDASCCVFAPHQVTAETCVLQPWRLIILQMAGITVDEDALDYARDAWRVGTVELVLATQVEVVSLGSALEAACWGTGNDPQVKTLLGEWGQVSPALHDAMLCLDGGQPHRPDDHAAPDFELRRCPSRTELEDVAVGVEWKYFLDRFRRSLAQRLLLGKSRSLALASALGEMVDNVVAHAGLGDEPRAVVAYEVSFSHFAFAVADVGRGVLHSLRENPRHVAIQRDDDALRAAVRDGASRRTDGRGHGFEQLLVAVADMEGRWSFRSGSARLIVDGRGTGARRWRTSNCPEMCGFQLSVHAEPQKSTW